jgi:hypothetical protein
MAVEQNWKGMDGATAFHLIERHAEGWDQTGQMMNAWQAAQSELFGYWDEEYKCFVPLEVAQGLIDLDSSRIHFLPLYRKVKNG